MQAPVGRVYVLTNARMPGLVKVGFTLGTVEGRAKELNGTGTPVPFEIAYQVEVRNPAALESAAHAKLRASRVNGDREFFELETVDAILCVRDLASERIDEEIHPRYALDVDVTARERERIRLAEQEQREHARLVEEERKQEAENAKKRTRYDKFVSESTAHKRETDRLRGVLLAAQSKLDVTSFTLNPEPLERNLPRLLTIAMGLSVVLGVGLILSDSPSNLWGFSGLVLPLPLYRIRSGLVRTLQKKDAARREYKKIQNEVWDAEYELEKLEKRKPKLDSELSTEHIRNFSEEARGAIKCDSQGFELPARNKR